MANDNPKACRERREKFINSLQENAATVKFAAIGLDEVKTDRTDVADVENQIELSKAHTKSLETLRDDKNKASMKKLDYVARAVEGDRNYGPDSALYEGFGYIRESEKKKGGGRKKTTPTT